MYIKYSHEYSDQGQTSILSDKFSFFIKSLVIAWLLCMHESLLYLNCVINHQQAQRIHIIHFCCADNTQAMHRFAR